ncbi:tetrahydromethanopterin S-methyltransferase subunit A [Novosphingobium chloroacetimidivorans]|uniref:Tetrahydromethanopterin S-methyltransferase subunit A n=1 Tax=Novosphingobium chloroacetimidivorans TaxID=1428314 RepID=A0A7W7KDU2_9SPHN|nr:hypothetical protein [Novosphingobium chloroacetimidivorans]MBB4860383.1 tetrahydromethanopterin S-methyltransferase subunit A [Novosphingobium chloroacetimidivorans]
MPDNLPSGIPHEMYAILIRIEAGGVRTEEKVDSLRSDMVRVVLTQDDHEGRIRKIETWMAKADAKVSLIGLLAKVICGLFSAQIAGFVIYLAAGYAGS